MDIDAYFVSIARELDALKNRVRYYIEDSHWQTDGEWKESVLRSVVRRHLPSNVKVGRGFIVQRDSCSSQIDVLIYDTAKPILYKDGDLLFIPPDAARGIIEVKSTIRSPSELSDASEKLAKNSEFIGASSGQLAEGSLFVGLFAYDTPLNDGAAQSLLQDLRFVADGKLSRVVNHVSLGRSLFIRFWTHSPNADSSSDDYHRWHAYHLRDKAQGYFVNNIIETVSREHVNLYEELWFPPGGKENRVIAEMPL